MYDAEINGIPEIYIKEIEKVIKDFLWDGKQPLLNIDTCYLSREEGGLDLPNIRIILKCMNIRTIYSIMTSKPLNWNIIGKYYLQSLDKDYGTDYFLCYCSSSKIIKDSKIVQQNAFYNKALSDWMEFRSRVNSDGSFTNIFGNAFITYKNKPILMKSFSKSGLIYMHDVWDQNSNKMKSENEILLKLADKRNWIAEFHILRNALRQYREKVNTCERQKALGIRFYKLNLFEGNNKQCDRILKLKQLKQALIFKGNPFKCENKWNDLFDFSFNWQILWSIIKRSKASAQAKQLQFKLNHQIIFTEQKLLKMSMSTGICTLCKNENESLRHLFWSCTNARQIWRKIMPNIDKYFLNVLQNEIKNEEITALFGWPSINRKGIIVNTMIFETKWHIWKNRNNVKYGKKPSLNPLILIRNIQKSVKERLELMGDEALNHLFMSNFC